MKTYHVSIAVSLAWLLFPVNMAHAFTLNVITNTGVAPAQSQQLISSTPYDRQVLARSPENITLTFSQPIIPDKSYIKLFDSFGTRLDSDELESHGMSISVQVPELSPGKYSVRWQARCRCDDDSDLSDSFHFSVR